MVAVYYIDGALFKGVGNGYFTRGVDSRVIETQQITSRAKASRGAVRREQMLDEATAAGIG